MNKLTHIAVIHLGSNLGHRESYLRQALDHIKARAGTLLKVSAVYQSEPWGLQNQPDFLNQAVLLSTAHSPWQLLHILLEIERDMGRSRTEKWGPRTIDLDIIAFDNQIIHEPALDIPHPRMHLRNFVLIPMVEIAPEWQNPESGKNITQLIEESPDTLQVKVLMPATGESSIGISMPELPWTFMAIEGNIGAGKTTLCQLMERDFGCKLILEQFAENPFLPFFYQNPERYAFPVELFFMTERHKQLQEELAQKSLFQNAIVADYFFLKTLLFAKNNLSEEEYRLFQRLFTVLNAAFPKPELLVFLHRPVDALMNNIKKRGRDYEQEISSDYLSRIQQVYFDFFKSDPPFPVLVLDLAEADFQQHTEHYYEIIRAISVKRQAGIFRVAIGAK